MIEIAAQTECCSEMPVPLDLCLPEESGRGLSNFIRTNRVRPLTADRIAQSDVSNPIVADVGAEQVLNIEATDPPETAVRDLTARHPSTIRLFELVAIDGVLKEVSEVRKQIEPVTQRVSCHPRRLP